MVEFASRRVTMVDTQVRPSDVTKYVIIEAMLTIPREDFVPAASREFAYAETNIDLGEGRMLLAARSFGKMLEAADIGAGDSVLDLGCGLGYSAAVIAHMAQTVVAVEPDADMAAEAQSALSEHGIDNAAIISGDLTEGAQSAAPFDAIILQGAIQTWPDSLTAQLVEGGRAVAFWEQAGQCLARVGVRRGDRMAWRDLFTAPAPMLPGFAKHHQFAL